MIDLNATSLPWIFSTITPTSWEMNSTVTTHTDVDFTRDISTWTTSTNPPYTVDYTVVYRSADSIIKMITLIIIMILSLIGNIMVVYVIGRYLRFRTVTNVFIICLAFSDLSTTVLCMPLSLVTVSSGTWHFGILGCTMNSFTIGIFGVVSSYMTMFICLDRFQLIVKIPSNNLGMRAACLVIGFCLVGAMLLSFPWSAILGTPEEKPALHNNHSYSHCMTFFHSSSSPQGAFFSLVFVSLCFVLPAICMCYCSCRILSVFCHASRQTRPATSVPTQLRFSGELRTAKTVLIMVGMYLICRLPYTAVAILSTILDSAPTVTMDTICMWLFWSNSAINPLIYASRNPLLVEVLHLTKILGSSSRPAEIAITRNKQLQNVIRANHTDQDFVRRKPYMVGPQNVHIETEKSNINNKSKSSSDSVLDLFYIGGARKNSDASSDISCVTNTTF